VGLGVVGLHRRWVLWERLIRSGAGCEKLNFPKFNFLDDRVVKAGGWTLVALATMVSLDAQQDRLCSIQGSVTNALTGEPLRKAYLRLLPTLGGKQSPNAVTDVQGKFVFEGVEAGTYEIEAQHLGFVNRENDEQEGSGTEFKLNAGDKLIDVSVKLMPQGAITGSVTDDDGDPWPHARLSLAKSTFKDGRRHLEFNESAEVDDQGQFRIAGLTAGKYFLFAEPDKSWERTFRSGDSHLEVSWYPNAADVSGSTPLMLGAGQSLSGVEIRLRRGTSSEHLIRGKVSAMDVIPPRKQDNPYGGPDVRAFLHSDLIRQESGGQLKENGSFAIAVSTPGLYDIIVTSGLIPRLALGTATVQVSDRNVDDVVVEVKPPQPLRGVIRVEGDDSVVVSGRLVELVSLGHSMGIPQAISKSDGTFAFGALAQEPYRVFIGGPSEGQFYLSRIRLGDSESRNGTFTLGGGDAVLELILSSHPANLAVSVTSQTARAEKVVLIPDSPDAAVREFRTSVGARDQNGIFTLHGLAPGAYRLFAFEKVPKDAWKDAEFFEAVRDRGLSVQVDEGASKSIEVPVLLKSELAGVLAKLGME
jgi:hypothetical protein